MALEGADKDTSWLPDYYHKDEPSHPSSSLVEFVPLMRSPATWTPAPVTLPPDIHPLPDDISAYFVYPYTLEDFVLHPQAPHKSHSERISKLHEEHEIRIKYLKEREDEKVRRRREALRKVAPGYEPPEEDDRVQTSGLELVNDGSNTLKRDESHRRSGILEPTRKSQTVPMSTGTLAKATSEENKAEASSTSPKPRDVMDDLVEGLARMDELESKPAAQ